MRSTMPFPQILKIWSTLWIVRNENGRCVMKTGSLCGLSIMFLLLSLLIIIPPPATALERYGQIICSDEGFTCHRVQKGESWESLFPDENQRAIVMRINRMNTMLHRNMVIAIPENLKNMDYMQYAPFDHQIEPIGKKLIIVDPAVLAFGAYDENGSLVRWGPISPGKNYCPDIGSGCRTKSGNFAVYSKGSEYCVSSKFPVGEGGAPMPYCMFFHGGYALHASTDVPGYAASHGCIRMFYEDAEWLSLEFVEKGTKVVVMPYET